MSKPRRRSSRSQPAIEGESIQRRSSWLTGYWLVLALLTVSYVLCAAQTSRKSSLIALLFQLVTVAVTLWVAEVTPRLRRIGLVLLAVVGVAAVAVEIASLEGDVLAVVLA